MRFGPSSAALGLGFLLAGGVPAANIPPVPEVDASTASARPELAERRAALVAERDALRARSKKQKAACGAVEERTPAERDCAAWLQRLGEEVELHVKATNDLAVALSTAAGQKAFSLPAIRVRGDVYFLTADGRKLTGAEAAGIAIDNRTKIFTGKDSGALLLLPDGTAFTVGPNSELVLDDFVYDPNTSTQKMGLKLTRGAFRWVTGKVAPRVVPRIDLPVGDLGFRGTDFECFVGESGSGYVKLYSGELEFTDRTTRAVMILTAGKMVTFRGTAMGAARPIAGDRVPLQF